MDTISLRTYRGNRRVYRRVDNLLLEIVKKPGLGLVVLENNPEDIRQKLVRLTPKGRKLADQLAALIGG